MKILKITITLIMIVISAIAVRNKILLDRCVHSFKQQQAELNQTRKIEANIQDAVIKPQTAAMMHLGKTIQLVNINKIFPNTSTKVNTPDQPRLILIFSELSCNVCQDEETRFGVSIASEYGKEYVMAIVHASNRRYVQNYIRMNQVNFPVYYCEDETFLKENGIRNTPMIFVLDNENRVVAANYPIPGQLQYSDPMHKFCYHYFNKEGKK
jgi:hypothetical protein